MPRWTLQVLWLYTTYLRGCGGGVCGGVVTFYVPGTTPWPLPLEVWYHVVSHSEGILASSTGV